MHPFPFWARTLSLPLCLIPVTEAQPVQIPRVTNALIPPPSGGLMRLARNVIIF